MSTFSLKISSIISSLCFITIASISTSCAQPKADRIDQLLTKYNEYNIFNGTVLVAQEGNVVYKQGLGYANFEWKVPNETTTKFRLASITKQFTAMLILQLAAEKQLALDSTISTYLPNYPKETGRKVSIHQLLNHTSGIPNYTSFPDYRKMMRQALLPGELLEVFQDSVLRFTPGDRFQYSNSGYAILGSIIETITKQSYEQVLNERIFKPLGMNNSGYDSHQKVLKNRASGYWMNGGSYVNANFIDMSVAFSAGGLYSTVEDLLLWDQALYTEKLLPQKFLDLLFQKHIPSWGGHYGYGWEIEELQLGTSPEKVPTIQHSGTINGFNTLIVRIPTNKTTIILLNNTSGAPLREIAQSINGILNNEPYKEPKRSMANTLYDIMTEKGVEEGQAYYNQFKKSDNYYLNEGELNLVGYNFLQQEKIQEAIAIFQINTKIYYQSSNVFDSYGEALLASGDTANAIKNYKKSLELNPKNQNGLDVLKGLNVSIELYQKLETGLYRTDESWRQEIFSFPIGFAKEIDYAGFEDARFTGGWAEEKSDEFWAYLFGWYIETEKALTADELIANLNLYFDGLMAVVNKDKEKVPMKTNTKIQQQETNDHTSSYAGDVQLYDAFFTKKSIRLNTRIQQHFCPKKKKSFITFRFSPKNFEHEVWSTLNAVKAVESICKDS